MATIPAPYCVSSDLAARDWWHGLPADCRELLARSWRDDGRSDPLHEVARAAADFLNRWIVEHEAPNDPMARELQRRNLAAREGSAADAGWDWATRDFYEYAVAHADFRDPALERPHRWEGVSSLPEARTVSDLTFGERLAKGSWWAL